MSRQLSLFSFVKVKKTKSENITKVVKSTLDSLISQVVDMEKKDRKNLTDYTMTKEKLQLWPKDERFFFWDTPGGIPSQDGKKVSWIQIDAVKESFKCWVCQKYPRICNSNNKVTVGCSQWHKNYLTRHDDEKHKVCLPAYILLIFLNSPPIF